MDCSRVMFEIRAQLMIWLLTLNIESNLTYRLINHSSIVMKIQPPSNQINHIDNKKCQIISLEIRFILPFPQRTNFIQQLIYSIVEAHSAGS